MKGLLSTVSEIWKSFPFAASRFACNYRGVKSKAHPPRMRGGLTDRPTDGRLSASDSESESESPPPTDRLPSDVSEEKRESRILAALWSSDKREKEERRKGNRRGRNRVIVIENSFLSSFSSLCFLLNDSSLFLSA